MPKNKYCRACQRAKMQEKPCREQSGLGPPPTYFGEQITVDHIFAHSDEAQGVTGDLDALAVYDRRTQYCECFPLWSKGADDAYAALVEFLGPHGKAHYFTRTIVGSYRRQYDNLAFPMVHIPRVCPKETVSLSGT